MFNFFRKKADVLNHWIAFADQFHTSPSEFYDALIKELAARKVPSMDMSRVEFAEGGLLSDQRVYLRMLRERLVFDVCAAPFGTGFFFSCRTAEIPLVLKLWQLAAVFVLSLVLLWALVSWLGLFWGFVVLLAGSATAIYVMRNAVALGLQDLDKVLIQSPLIGSVYEVWFRKPTYHRVDSQLCYIQVVNTLVKQLAEDTTAEKGVKLVNQFELAPMLGDLYQPAEPTPRQPGPPPPPLPT